MKLRSWGFGTGPCDKPLGVGPPKWCNTSTQDKGGHPKAKRNRTSVAVVPVTTSDLGDSGPVWNSGAGCWLTLAHPSPSELPFEVPLPLNPLSVQWIVHPDMIHIAQFYLSLSTRSASFTPLPLRCARWLFPLCPLAQQREHRQCWNPQWCWGPRRQREGGWPAP